MNKAFKFLLTITFYSVTSTTLKAQTPDSLNTLNQVVITSFKRSVPLLETTGSSAKISTQMLQTAPPERLLEAVNLIPGTKLEERSPGSYRVSLRGSTIRSPFGVRNVKIYFDDFILTDASGNSYLNLIDPYFIQSIDVSKGPQGGEIGSETGGVLLLNSTTKANISLDLSGGSYAMFGQKFNFSKQLGKHFLQIAQAYYDSDSYREQAAVNRKSFFIKDQYKYNTKNSLNATLLFTDLAYQTPGGLTAQQMETNRRQARLATATLPGAVTQKAGIYNKTVLGGLSHWWQINEHWSQFTLVQSSYTDFKNPFISNFETRKESNFQGRLFVQYKKAWDHFSTETRLGLEAGTNSVRVKNYDNNQGVKAAPQKFDDLDTQMAFYYITQRLQFNQRWFLDAGLSLNTMRYTWETLFPNQLNGNLTFKNEVLPNLGLSYKINPNFVVRAKVAKGNSSPTTEEVRSSNQEIATDLAAENGWNKEIGIRKQLGPLFLETTFFDFRLTDAIVKRQDLAGNDYFINAGGTKQQGAEFLIETKNFTFNKGFVNGFKAYVAATYYDFTYKNYQNVTTDFSGKRLPGISKWALQSFISLDFAHRFNVTYSNYYTSNQFLNDANTVKEKGFVVGNAKLTGRFNLAKNSYTIYVGAQNIYNTKYSAGYDLNAFGNRFYNPAALANFYAGCTFIL